MKRPKIYIDTSIVGGCLDEEFAEESRLLISMAMRGEVCLLISDIMLEELTRAPEEVQIVIDGLPDDHMEHLQSTAETESLRDAYLAEDVLGAASAQDAHHIAVATVHKADMVVSWNFRHIVHYDKIRRFNAVNIREGYGSIEIYSPKEVV